MNGKEALDVIIAGLDGVTPGPWTAWPATAETFSGNCERTGRYIDYGSVIPIRVGSGYNLPNGSERSECDIKGVHRVYEDLHIVFQNDGGPANLRFIEVETPDGKSVRAGRWIKRDGFDVLVLCVHRFDIRSDISALPPTPEAPHE